MKILILHKAMVIGGIERNLLTYTKILNKLNHQIHCLFTYNLSNSKIHLQAELSQYKCNLHYILSPYQSDFILKNQVGRSHSLKSKFYYETSRCFIKYKQILGIKKLINHQKFDLIIDFSGVLDRLNLNISIPIIRWFQSEVDIEHFIDKPHRFYNYTKIITLTEASKYRLIKFQPNNADKFECIHNPIDHTELESKSLYPTEINDSYLLTVSRLVEGKGLLELIDIYFMLKNKGVKHKLYIVGDGELREKLQYKITSLGLSDDCILLGNKINPYPYFKNAKLFLFTSESEGLGIVILESLCFSVPTVVMDCPSGPREILGEQNKYGKLIPMHDKNQFVDSVMELLNNPISYQYYQNKSYQRSLDFSVERITQDIHQLLISIWNSKA